MGFVLLLALFVGMWMLLVRPQQQRLRAQRALVSSLQIGDQVVTAGGIIGRITRLDDRDADIEVAPGIILTFLRPAVSRKLEPQGDEVANTGGIEPDDDAGSIGAGGAGGTSPLGGPGASSGPGGTVAGPPAATTQGEDNTEEGTV